MALFRFGMLVLMMICVHVILTGAQSASPVTQLYVDQSATQGVEYGAAAVFSDVFKAQMALRSGHGNNTHRIVNIVGNHHLKQPLMLDSSDSGSQKYPIEWRGVDGSRLSGGIDIPVSKFSKASVPSGVDGVVKADLFSLGFNKTSLGMIGNPYPTAMSQLYVDGKPMTIARTPNINNEGTWMWYGYEDLLDGDMNSFTFSDLSATKAMQPAVSATNGLWLHAYTKFDWRDCFLKIDNITAVNANSSIYKYTRDPATPPQYDFTKGSRFYAVDNLHFLDAPGEYFIDRDEGILYFYPLQPLSPTSQLTVSFLPQVISNTGASHLSFVNLIVSDATGTVFSVTDGTSITLANSTVSNGGGSCASLTGTNLSIVNNLVFGCGRDGISIDSGDVKTLVSGHSSVVGNTVTNFSLIARTYMPAIGFSGVGNYFANNTLSHGPHTAITGGGNNNLFEFNSISHMCFECIDTGAFYVGRSWSQRGNVVRYNHFDTIRPTERLAQKSCSQNAFYLDDQMSGYEFYGNTIVNSTTGVLLGGGRRNHIHDNIFINNDLDIEFDDRGLTWQTNYCNYNCTSSQGDQPACFLHELQSLNYTQPPYSTAYPELLTIYQDHPCTPVYNVIANNTYCHAKSVNGGNFISATPEQIVSWMSSASNNIQSCPPEYQ